MSRALPGAVRGGAKTLPVPGGPNIPPHDDPRGMRTPHLPGGGRAPRHSATPGGITPPDLVWVRALLLATPRGSQIPLDHCSGLTVSGPVLGYPGYLQSQSGIFGAKAVDVELPLRSGEESELSQ